MDCFDNDLENTFENNAWKLEHNAEELQEILKIMQGIVCIISYLSPSKKQYNILNVLNDLGGREEGLVLSICTDVYHIHSFW